MQGVRCATLAVWPSVAQTALYAQFPLVTRVRMVRRVSQREGVMTFSSSWLQAVKSGWQRFGAGIDIGSQALRLVVVSQRSRARGALHLEYLCTMPLGAGAMVGSE